MFPILCIHILKTEMLDRNFANPQLGIAVNGMSSKAMHCIRQVPPSTFCEMWVRDAEYVNNRCVALAAYVASCHKFNICIEWRSQEYCRESLFHFLFFYFESHRSKPCTLL